MESALIVAMQSVIMLILLSVGYGFYKGKMLGGDAVKQLSNITISVINPIVIFNAYQTEFAPEKLRGLLIALILSFAAQGILAGAAAIIVRADRDGSETERFALTYSNCAFMGIPLVEATFGSDGVFYLTAFITAFNAFMWTHGVVLMSGGGKKTARERIKGMLKILVSPAILSIVLGLVFFFTGWRLPDVIQQPLNYLGSMNTPLAMIVSGATIAKAGLSDCFKNSRVYLLQSVKLLVVPILLTALFVPVRIFGVESSIVNTILIAAAAPTASATIMFAYKYGKNEKLASNHFALSTIASMLTIPLILTLSGLISSLFIP